MKMIMDKNKIQMRIVQTIVQWKIAQWLTFLSSNDITSAEAPVKQASNPNIYQNKNNNKQNN